MLAQAEASQRPEIQLARVYRTVGATRRFTTSYQRSGYRGIGPRRPAGLRGFVPRRPSRVRR